MAAVLAAAMLFSSYPLPAYAAGDPEGDLEYTVVEEGQDDGLVSGDEADAVSEDEAVSVSGGDADAASENETEAAEEDVASENETASGSKKDDTFVESEIPTVVTDNFELVGNAQDGSGLEATELYFSDFSSTTDDRIVPPEYVLFQPGGDFDGKDSYFFNGVWNGYYLDCSSEVVFNGFTIYDDYPVYRGADSANKIIVKKNISETINISSASKNEVTAYAQFRDEGTRFEHTGIKFNTVEDSEVAVVAKGGSGSKVYLKVEDPDTQKAVTLSENIPTAGTDKKSSVVLFKAAANKTCYISADPGVCLYFVKVMPRSTNKSWDFTKSGIFGSITDGKIEGTTAYIDGMIVDAREGGLWYDSEARFNTGAKLHLPVYDNSVVRISLEYDPNYFTKIKVNGKKAEIVEEATFECVEGSERAGYITIESDENVKNHINRFLKIEIMDAHSVTFKASGETVGEAVFGDRLWLDERAVALAVEAAVAAAPEGKVFAGWSETENGEAFDFSAAITENKTFHAIYEDASRGTGELYFSDINNLTDEGKLKYRFASVNGFTIYDRSDSQNCIGIGDRGIASIPVSSAREETAATAFGYFADNFDSKKAYITFKPEYDSDIVIVAQKDRYYGYGYIYMETDGYKQETTPAVSDKASVLVFEAKAGSLCKIWVDYGVDLYYIKVVPRSTSWDLTTGEPFGDLGDEISGKTAYANGMYIDTTAEGARISKNSNTDNGIHLGKGSVIYVQSPDGAKLKLLSPNGHENILVNGTALTSAEECVTVAAGGSDRPGYSRISVKADAEAGADLKKLEFIDPISAKVTFKVVNGSWNEGEGTEAAADKNVALEGFEGDILKLSAEQIPAAGNKPDRAYKAGSWDVTPDTATSISEDTVYTYTYAALSAAEAVTAPKAKTISYNGSAQELVEAGSIDSYVGTLKYAVTAGTVTTAPASGWTESVPEAKYAGSYSVFYKVEPKSGHEGLDPVRIPVTIGPKTVAVSGIKVDDKYYDGNVGATFDYRNLVISGKVNGDDLGVIAEGVFPDYNSGTEKTVEFSLSLNGAAKDNYILENSQQSDTADILRAKVSINGIIAKDKEYDGTKNASLDISHATYTGLVAGESVSFKVKGEFASAGIGNNKTVNLSGWELISGAGNYEIDEENSQQTATADITDVQVYISGITAQNKVYDGNSSASVNGSAVLKRVSDNTAVSGLTVENITAVFSDENAANNKSVTITGGTLSDADNYTLNIDKTNEVLALTANITKADALNASIELEKEYLYSRDNADSITLTGLPEDFGTVSWNVPTTIGLTFDPAPTVSDNGVLSYTVKAGEENSSGSITVVAETQNYNDVTFTVSITLIDQIPVKLKNGSSVTLKNNTLTYGQKLSVLQFNSVQFVSDDVTANAIAGTIAWKEPDSVPNAGTTSAAWVFTPTDSQYAACEGTVAITVNKATPVVSTVPTASAITYGQALSASTLNGGSATANGEAVTGTFTWKTGVIKPSVADSNKTAYDVVFTPTDSTNYENAECKVKLVVNKADIPNGYITAPTAKTLIYNGTAQELVNAGSAKENGVTIGTFYYAVTASNTAPAETAYTTSIPKATNADTYYVWYRIEGNSNWNSVAAKSVQVTIVPKAVVVSGITAGNKTYDGTTAATLNYSNVKFDNAKVSGLTVTATGVFEDADAGTGKTVKISGITLTGTVASNYTLASNEQQSTTTANITKASHDNKTATASAKYGNSGTVDLKDLMEAEGTLSYYSKSDSYSIISDTPAVNGSVLTFSIANKASATGKTATITVKAGSKNYQDYYIVVTVSVQDKDEQTVTFAGVTDGAVSAVYGDVSDTKTASTTGDGAISYSSSNTNVAAVDSASGKVTIKGAGSATITATAAETDEYKAGTASYTLTVAKKPVTVSSISANNKVYDGSTSATLNTTNAAFGGILTGDTLTVTATGTFADANVGTDKAVTISGWTLGGASKDNYKVAESGNQTNAKADITARAITIKADDQRVEIGKSIAEGVDNVSVTVGSLADGQRISSVKLTSTSTNALTESGKISVSEAVIVSGSTETTANYDITYEEGVMTVTNLKALITEEPVKAENLVYTGVSQNLITSRGTAETSVEFSLNGTDYYDAIPTGTDAKTYTVYYRAKGGEHNEPSDPNEISVTIEKAPLTVTASANTITYGDAPAGNGVTYAGFVNNETETVLKGTLAYDYTYQQYGNVGTYDIIPKGLTADNYELTFVKGTLIVAKKAVTVSANAQTIAKDGKISTSLNQAAAITPVGEDKLSAVTLTASINAAATEGVIIPSAAKFSRGTDDVTANYEISYANGKLTIKPAAVVTVAPAAKTLSYNGTDQELVTAGTVSGGSIVYSLSENGTYSESIPTGKDAGTYTVYYKPVPDDDHSEGETGSVEVTIAKASANVKADDKIKTVGKADPELTATVNGTYGSDSINYTLSRESGEAAGTYVITASGNAVQGNYDVSYTNGVFTISANSITPSVSLSQVIYTYDGTEKKPAVTVKAGETILAETDYTVTYANNINAGTADVTVSEAEGGSYSFDPVTVHFTIEKAAITPSVSINSWVYGEEASKPAVNGNAGNGAVTFTYKVKDAEDSTYSTEIPANMGSYTVKADIAETENYLSGSATADFEITMAEQGSSELKFIFEEGEPKPEYTGSAVTPKVLGYCGNELLTEGVDYSVKYSKNVNAGTAEAKISGKGDYNGEETLNFTIVPKNLSDESGAPAEGIVVTGLVVQPLQQRISTSPEA